MSENYKNYSEAERQALLIEKVDALIEAIEAKG